MAWQPSSAVVLFLETHDGSGIVLTVYACLCCANNCYWIDRYVKELPNQPSSQSSQPRTMRVVHVSVQPKTWLGKLIAGLIGVAIILAVFFLSIFVFAIIASILVIAIIYMLWATHRARRATRNHTIDGVVKNRDIQ